MVVTMSEDHLTPSANPPVDVTSWTQATDPRDRSRAGIATRTKAPLDAHAIWKVKEGRREAISLLEEQSAIRVPDLIPLRYKRMSASPFTFYRGTVLIMTNDLASTPVTGIPVQCVGDAHIGNFGIFRSPSARLVFDINDFDETAIGPWEWDLKRLAASVEICGRANKIKEKDRRAAVVQCVHTYRTRMKWFSEMDYLDAWYEHLDVEETLDRFETTGSKRSRVLREAAMKALHIAPGLHRRFAAERYAFVPAGTFQRARADALEQVVRDAPFEAVGFDIDGDAVALAAHNAKLAGVASHVRFYRADVKDFAPRAGSLVFTNPPYGERLGDAGEAAALAKTLGQVWQAHPAQGLYAITADAEFEQHFGKKAARRRKIYNGMIPCQLYMYFEQPKRERK